MKPRRIMQKRLVFSRPIYTFVSYVGNDQPLKGLCHRTLPIKKGPRDCINLAVC